MYLGWKIMIYFKAFTNWRRCIKVW